MVMFWFYLTWFFLGLAVYRPFSVGGIARQADATDPANTVFISNRNDTALQEVTDSPWCFINYIT